MQLSRMSSAVSAVTTMTGNFAFSSARALIWRIAVKRRNVGVLITDHNVHEMLELVDRAYVIHAGRLLFEGEPRAILHDPDVRRLYLGKDFEE